MSASVHILPAEGRPASLQSSNTSKDDQEKGSSEEKNLDPAVLVAADTGKEDKGGSIVHEDDAPMNGLAAVSWKWKLAALLCVIFLSMGSNFCGASLAPLKSTIRAEVPGVTNARYGAISSSASLINAVLPILSGIIIDYYGPTYASVICSTFILLGSIVVGVGGQKASFGILLAGEIIMGFGSTSIETAQSKLYTHWFRGTKDGNASMALMGFVFGLDIAMGRVFNLMGGQTAVPIGENTGRWYFSFWLGAIMTAITLVINILYVCIEKAMPATAQVPTGRQVARAREARGLNRDGSERSTSGKSDAGVVSFVRTRLVYLSQSFWTIPAGFWLVALSQLLQAGAILGYTSNSADAIEKTRHTTRLTAGYTSSLSQIMPIVLTPLVGLGFDRFGRRMHVVAAIAALWVVVFALLAYSSVHPLVPVLLGSFALSANAIPFIAAIPLLVPNQASIGTAFGIWKAFNSAGSTIVDISVGAIQDGTPDGGYSRVFAFLIALKAVDILFGCFYHYIDRRYLSSVLFLSERKRIEQERQQGEGHEKQGLLAAKKSWTIAGMTIGCALISTAYVLYIVYSYQA